MVGATTAIAGILTDLFVLLLAAKLGDELFKRIGQPALVGEILAGVLVGPAVLGLVEPGEAVEVFAELGVVFLLFWVGLETRIGELREVGGIAARVGLLGVALPLAGGLAVGLVITDSTGAAVFVGAALVATSVGITSAVLLDLGVLGRPASRTILGAAVIDDILAMIVLAVAVGISAEGGIAVGELIAVIALALGFVAFFALGGTAFVRRRPALLHAP
ncbi:MAG TPA: cation:proton antiporter, partial [Gaiellaceae bacterium]|nr:cation:proton antiporter [Gaiellaceae bacterium]